MSDEKDSVISDLRRKLTQAVDLLESERAEKRLPKNLDFVQISRKELRAISELGEQNPLGLKVLMMLAQVMNKQNAVVMSFDTMIKITGKSRSALSKAVSELKRERWLQVVKVGTANAYVLNSAVFWTDRGDKRYTASFSAQVVTTLDEQDKDLRECPDVQLKRIPFIEQKEQAVLGNDEIEPPDQQDLDI